MKNLETSSLLGKTFIGVKQGDDVLQFYCAEDKCIYEYFHMQDCCEHVYIEDICGDLQDLVGAPIIQAEEINNADDPIDVKIENKHPWFGFESYTWTFYKFATIKGSVTVRWIGLSNGYYSESVDFRKIKM